jgi:hypothetical protein
MMKQLTCILFSQLTLFVTGFCQRQPSFKDSIEIHSDFFTGISFYQNDKKLSTRDMFTRMRTNPVAFKYFNKSRTNNTIGFIIGFVGGFCIGYELAQLAFNNKGIQWGVIGTGIGLVGISIPFSIWETRNARTAVYYYNSVFR